MFTRHRMALAALATAAAGVAAFVLSGRRVVFLAACRECSRWWNSGEMTDDLCPNCQGGQP